MPTRTELKDLQRSFVPPPGLGRSQPREVRLTAGGRAVLVAAVLLVALAIGVFVTMSSVAIRQADDRHLLRESGVDATAEVTRLWRSSGDSHAPRVAYRFALAGQIFERDARISLARWRTLRVGSPLPIRFPGGHPERSVPRGTEGQAMPLWVPFVVSAAIAVGGVICVVWLNFERRLVSQGRAAPGIVTKVTKHQGSHGSKHWHMRYEFPLLSGATSWGKSSAARNPPAVGSAICVLYDPERPSRSALYPLKLVRPDVLRNP